MVGVNPPFHHPVFVLTHHARAPLELEGGTTFTFVTDGIKAVLERARRTAGGKDVSLATFTLVHVLLSLIRIASGFVVMSGLLSYSRLGLNGRARVCVTSSVLMADEPTGMRRSSDGSVSGRRASGLAERQRR